MTLKRELEQASSPLRQFLTERFPNDRVTRTQVTAQLRSTPTVAPATPVPWDVHGHVIGAHLAWSAAADTLTAGGQPSEVTTIQFCSTSSSWVKVRSPRLPISTT